MTPEAVLRGRRVLVPRPGRRGEGLARALRRLGAEPDLRPAIAFAPPPDPEAAARASEDLERFDWIVVTSPTGVEALAERRADLARVRGPKVAAIGPGTARRLEVAGRAPDVVAERSDSEGLAAALEGRVRAGETVLLVRPEVASQTVVAVLRNLGAIVEPVAFYRTVPHPAAGEIARGLLAGAYDAAVLTSPSTLRALLEALPPDSGAVREALGRIRRVAIGRVTAAAMEAEGLPADVIAERPDDEAIAAAVAAAFGTPGAESLC